MTYSVKCTSEIPVQETLSAASEQMPLPDIAHGVGTDAVVVAPEAE